MGAVHHRSETPLADELGPLFHRLLGSPPPLRIELWDGSSLGDPASPHTLFVRGPDAIRHLAWSPDELGMARAYVTGLLDADGDVAGTLRALQTALPQDARVALEATPSIVRAARATGAFGHRPALPDEEFVPRGIRHSLRRDREVISHHYDVGNDFYALILGASMTYSCARFVTPDVPLADAQAAKHELICRKLGLPELDRPRLLDIGCGWGSMAIHAATHHGAHVVGVTLSVEQATAARERVDELGLAERVDIRVQDYREVDDGPFDAVSSVGMAEHVGSAKMGEYCGQVYDLLRPGGRFLNHAISSVGGSKLRRRSFVYRYVFPDGELLDLADTVRFMEEAGFEVRDVENLREHYATTLRHWVANLEAHWDEAVALVGERRARVWLLYMSGSINGFDDGGLQLMQTLGVKLHPDGRSDMPPTRAGWG